jgi:hypothetical protein
MCSCGSRILRQMLAILIYVTAFASAGAIAAEVVNHNGKRYEYTFHSQELAKAPAWLPTKENNPPISARLALSSTKAFVQKIPAGDEYRWEFRGISLVQVVADDTVAEPKPKFWAWRGSYLLRPQSGATTGGWPTIRCYILMNGQIIEPVVTDLPSDSRGPRAR